ncbi:alpha/beta hydrolase, partial [bacterium]|nr:alpha/beta hydrolase [bacterium]
MKTQHNAYEISPVRTLSIFLLLALLLPACSGSSGSASLPAGLSDAVTGKVDVGGVELYYICAGEGSPTVILEAGGGQDSSSWELVMLYSRGYTRVCAYDRANLGKSGSASKPRTFNDSTNDLHTLLQNASIEGPYIMAGHSMGGMLIRLYADQHPEDVLGLVLVDSAHPDMGERLLSILPPEKSGEYKSFKTWRQYGNWMSSSDGNESFDDEGMNMRESNEQVRAVKSLGDLPLVVISRSPQNPVMVGGFPSLPDDVNTALMQQWQD